MHIGTHQDVGDDDERKKNHTEALGTGTLVKYFILTACTGHARH